MKYLCFFDSQLNRRTMKMASVNKVHYICSALNQNGIDVEIISCSMTAPHSIPAQTERLNEHTSVKYFKTAKASKSKPAKLWQLLRRNLTIFFFLLFNTKKGETVACYHSLINMRCVSLAKKLRGFRLLLEAEEIYNDVFERSPSSRRTEMKYLQKCADMYLFPTDVLARKINIDSKPQAIVYGAYEFDGGAAKRRVSDGKIRVAYTGSFDPNKGGLSNALGAARFLDSRYSLNILGTDTPDRVETLKRYISEHSGKDSCEIRYDGVKKGKDYTDWLRGCDIGLSTQNPEASFNETSFPSKVISYLSCNLRVVAYPIQVLAESELNEALFFYRENTPQAIADAVKDIDFSLPYDGESLIARLDASFQSQLKNLNF